MALWDSLLGIGSTLLGGVLGGTSGATKNDATKTETQDPWKVQQPYLLGGFQGATNNYTDAMKNPVYQGDLYAGLNPMQQGAINGIQGFATGAGANAANGVLNASMGMMPSASNGMTNAANGLLNMSSQDPTQGNIQAAGAYANNPFLNDSIDAASRDVTRNLTEQVLPGINRVGSGTGNTNSTRTGIAEGLALRGAQDRIGDISATMRGDAWNKGLATSEAARQANMQGVSSAGGLYNNAMDNALRGAATGSTLGYNNLDALSKAGGMLQTDAQGNLNADLQQYMNNQQMPSQWLDNYMQAIKGNYGGTTVNSANNGQSSMMNGIQGALGGAAGGLSLYNNFKDLFK
jgi:hypothetical protein